MIFRGLLGLAALTCATLAHAESTKLEVAVEGYNNEPIVAYSAESDFARLGRPIGQLRVATDVGILPCTAFVVSEQYILTNHHCGPGVLEIGDHGASRINGITLMMGYVNPGQPEEAEVYQVNPVPVEVNAALDYVVLEVQGNPSAKYGTLPLSDGTVTEGMPFLIIGHPLGKSQHISREGCRAARPALTPDRVRHTCDTLGGNSGSPIIDVSSRMVVGLHNSGDSAEGVNYGVPMAMILSASSVLKAAVPDTAPPPAPVAAAITLYPKVLGVGDQLSITADAPPDCAPAFFNLTPGNKVFPIPSDAFERIELSPTQVRYQITASSRFRIGVEPQDENGVHRFGFLCPPVTLQDSAGLATLLKLVAPELRAGRLSGTVPINGAPVLYRFADWTVQK